MLDELLGRVALVTGAGRGIGRAIALGFAAEGAEVVTVARTVNEIEAVAREIVQGGGSAHARSCDVSSAREVSALAEWLAMRYDRLDVLVNNAGMRMNHVGDPNSYYTTVLELTIDEWDCMIATNLRGPFLTSKLLFPLMRAAGRASVINMSALAGGRPTAPPSSAWRASRSRWRWSGASTTSPLTAFRRECPSSPTS